MTDLELAEQRLKNPLVSTLLFGGVFLVAFVWNGALWALGARPGPEHPSNDPEPWVMVAGFMVFAIGSGLSVSLARRLPLQLTSRNWLSGCLCGAWYSLACWETFGASAK